MLDGTSNVTNTYGGLGTSFAAPTVGGVAGLIAAGNLAIYATPDGDALKADLLANHTVEGTGLGGIPGSRLVSMTNLP
jgi:hypothetical protein